MRRTNLRGHPVALQAADSQDFRSQTTISQSPNAKTTFWQLLNKVTC